MNTNLSSTFGRAHLGFGEIHIWLAMLDVSKTIFNRLKCSLELIELRRAERFYFDKDKKQYIVARGLLREILGYYLCLDPSHITFGYTKSGKPYLANQSGNSALRFNLSYSCGLALVGITSGKEIGVDVERIDPEMRYKDIAKRFFSRKEFAELLAQPENMQRREFFRMWTFKEAFIKATGKGLVELDKCDIFLNYCDSSMATTEDSQQPTHWSLKELELPSGYVGAVVSEGIRFDVQRWSCLQYLST